MSLGQTRRAAIAVLAASMLALLGLALPGAAAAITTGACVNLAVGPPEEVVSDATRDASDLPGWPDGALGVLPRGDGTYDFYGTDAFGGSPRPQRLTVTHGTLDNPLAFGVTSRTQVVGVPETFQWSGGGPVFRDPASGMILQVMHLERNHTSGGGFWSEIGLGRVNPATGQTTFLGLVVAPELSYEASNANHWTADMGFPSFVIANHNGVPWFHFYFADFREAAPGVFAADGLSVAGAPVQQVLEAAAHGTVSPWFKLYKGAWTQPGLGGHSDDLQAGQPQAWAPKVAHSNELGAYFMAAATGPHEVVLSTSADGVSNWSPRVPLFNDPSYYDAYVNLIGRGGDPTDLGNDFYLYYTQWLSPTPDWTKAHLLRRAIHCEPAPPAPAPPAPPAPAPAPKPKPKRAKAAPRGLKISRARLTWRDHRLVLGVRGRVLPPRGVTRCEGGRVSIGLRLGKAKRPRLKLDRKVAKDCSFAARAKLRPRRRPRRATLTLGFGGNARLRAGASKRIRLRIHG